MEMDFEENFNKTIEELCKVHKIASFKPLQRLCLKNLLLDRDVLACLPTGFGKSLVFQTWPTACRILANVYGFSKWPEEPILLVVCPLMSIIEDQIRFLDSIGISAACAGESPEVDYQIERGKYPFVFGSPETLVGNKRWRKMLQTPIFQQRLVGIAVDEVHTVIQWGEGGKRSAPFRKWCGLVGELRSIIPKSVPVLAVTATASKETRQDIIKHIGLINCVEIVQSPDRANIRLASKKVDSDPVKTFAWLCKELELKGTSTEKVLIYCNSISDCSLLYEDVFKQTLGSKFRHPEGADDISGNRLVDMFHSETAEDVKADICNSLKVPSSTLRVILATSALGMGVDFTGLNMVVNYGPPRDTEAYMQALGRAGRDGSNAHSLILYHGRQLVGVSDQMRDYLSDNETCRRAKLMHLFDGEKINVISPSHSCCGFCASSCECNPTCDGQPSQIERFAGEKLDSRQRTVSERQKRLLSAKLEDIGDDLILQGFCGGLTVYSTATVNLTDDTPANLIQEVIERSDCLFTLQDIFTNVSVSTIQQAQAILKVLGDIFKDL